MDLDDVLQASENLNADINHGQLLPTLKQDIVQVNPLSPLCLPSPFICACAPAPSLIF